MYYFTADTHFNHRKVIQYCNRPFSCLEEMHEVLLENINRKVKVNDTLRIQGDFAFGRPQHIEDIRAKIKCKDLRIIIGSHDREIQKSAYLRSLFTEVVDFGTTIKVPLVSGTQIRYQEIILCHYAMKSWPKSHYGTWHLFGHHHGKLKTSNLSFDCGVDCWNFSPLSLIDVSNIFLEKAEKIAQNI